LIVLKALQEKGCSMNKYKKIFLLSTFFMLASATEAQPYNASRSLFNELSNNSVQSISNQSLTQRSLDRRTNRKNLNQNASTALTDNQIHQGISKLGFSVQLGKQQHSLISKKQQTALHELSTRSHKKKVVVRFNNKNGTPSYIKAKPLTSVAKGLNIKPKPAIDIAKQFLTENHQLLKLKTPTEELKLLRKHVDKEGQQHLHFQQQHHGVAIWGKQLAIHLDKDASVYMLNGRYVPTLAELNVEPTLNEKQALVVINEIFYNKKLNIRSNELVIFDENNPAKLTYKIDFTHGLSERWLYFIDAHSGDIVHYIKNIHTGSVVAASGQDALDGTSRSFTAWQEGTAYFMIDPTIPNNDVNDQYDPIANGINAIGDMLILTANNGNGDQLFHNTSADANSGWDPVAVSAMHNTRTVYDYYLNTFNRNSFDGKGKNLLVVTRYEQNYNNAFWNGTYMVYGDGDGQLFSPLVQCQDIAAHEMTHGVIESSANFIYENQSGALSESFSDFFGAMVDRDDWLLGEDCTVAEPGYLRSMSNPESGLVTQPRTMSKYVNLPNTEAGNNGGVHINSGIPNYAAYLTAEKIGRIKTEQIYYRALTIYLTASAQFIDARRALIQSAEDLYGAASVEVEAVKTAWNDVEITEGSPDTPNDGNEPPPNSTDQVEGDEMMVYLVPVDGSYNNIAEEFALYKQTLPNPFQGYDRNFDQGPLNSVVAAHTRPSAYTDDFGTYLLYVGTDRNIYGVSPDNSNLKITTTGNIASIAVSPNGKFFAYTSTDNTDNKIHVLNLEAGNGTGYPIVLPNYQETENSTIGRVRFADALSFDFTSSALIFDMIVCISQPDNTCVTSNPVSGFNYWSIGILDIGDETPSFRFPFPTQNSLIDLGFPTFATNNSSIIAMDVITSDQNSNNIHSQSVTVDLEKQEIYPVADFGNTTFPFFGVASFLGDDAYISFQSPVSGPALISAFRSPLGTTNSPWEAQPGVVESLNNFAVALPIMHRAGKRIINDNIETDQSMIDFGNATVSETLVKTLTLTNTGNKDVNITDIILEGTGYSHNATNQRIIRGSSVTVDVRYAAGLTEGTRTGTLSFTTNGTPTLLTVSLTATTIVETPTPTPTKTTPTPNSDESGSGGGGVFIHLLSLLLLIFLMSFFRYRLPKSKRAIRHDVRRHVH